MKFITFFSSGVTGDVHSCQHKCSEGLYKMYILSVFNNNNCVLEFSTLVGKLLWFWTYNHKLSCGIDWMCLSRQASSLSSDRQELRTSRKCLVHLCGSIHPRYPCLRIPDRRKTVILGNFSNLGLPYPEGQPLYRQGPNLVCHTLCSVTSRILSRYSAAFGRQKPKFYRFWSSAFCDVTNWRRMAKVERGYTTANLRVCNGIKTVSILQQLHGEIVRRTSVVQKRDEHTDNKKASIRWQDSARRQF